jgi:hypothetical protein
MAPKTAASSLSAAEIDDAAADFEQFQAQVPDKPRTSISSAPAPVAAQASSSGAPKKKPAARRGPPKKATAEKASAKMTVSTDQANDDDSDAEAKQASLPKGKGKATSRAKGKRKAAEADLDANYKDTTEDDAADDNDAADEAVATSPPKGKGRAPAKPRASAKPRGPAKRRKTEADTTRGKPDIGMQTDPTTLYFVFTTLLYPEKTIDRAEAAAIHYTQRGPIPKDVMDAFIYGKKLGKPWADKKLKNPYNEKPEEDEETAKKEAKRREIIREGKQPERAPETATTALSHSSTAMEDPTPVSATNTADESWTNLTSLGSTSPFPPEAPSQETAYSKRKRDDDGGAETPPSTGKKRKCLSEHNLREHLMATDIGPESGRIPNQLKKKPDEASSSSSSSSSGPISVRSPPSPPSLGSDDLQVQGVPLLSRIRIERECVVFDTLESANLYAMDEMMAIAKPPRKARPEEKITYKRDIVELVEEQYRRCTEDAEPDEFGDRTVTLELEPNVCHYRWNFLSAQVQVMRMILPSGSIFHGQYQGQHKFDKGKWK